MAMAMPRLKTLSRHLATGSKRFAGDARWRCASSSSSGSPTWSLDGIEYRRLEPGHDPEALFQFNKEHGSTPLNFIPDGPVREHFGRLATGETTVWAAFSGDEMAGFITGELGGGYWLQTEPGQDASLDNDGTTCFINEFVVNPKFRRKRIGVRLTTASVDPEMGIWASNPAVTSMYTTVHVDNIASRTAFIKGGYSEAVTYTDQDRDRNTTVLKKAAPGAEIATAQRGNSRTMRVIGVQSGNAVDGIDVGIFDFEPVDRSPADPRALNKSLEYTMVANKTFPFTPEQRQYVLGLRAMNRVDGNDYAEGNYAMGEWCASAINGLLDESGIDRSSCALIGSHGQTVSGHPHWEFGDLSVIAQQTCITVAGDFRPADVAAGGNGTPCTCTYDSIMLRPEAGREKWRVAINIGGTSSVTFCPPWPTAEQVGPTQLPVHWTPPQPFQKQHADPPVGPFLPGRPAGHGWSGARWYGPWPRRLLHGPLYARDRPLSRLRRQWRHCPLRDRQQRPPPDLPPEQVRGHARHATLLERKSGICDHDACVHQAHDSLRAGTTRRIARCRSALARTISLRHFSTIGMPRHRRWA